jgi:serine/threonine-protein kinase
MVVVEPDPPGGVDLPVPIGEIVGGKYKIERLLGVGGVGIVLAATQLPLGQPVAIKLLRNSALQDSDSLKRLEREAQIISRMKSPHVPHVLDVGTLPSGSPYVVMEMLEGADLGRHLEARGTITVGEAVDFVVQACEAVAEAHSLGVVHRDLKPSNLFLTWGVDKKPLIKVLDFGLSKVSNHQPGATKITQNLEVAGTPEYMSPEQLRSLHDVDARTDIWSLGIILYEFVSGRSPFGVGAIGEVTAAIMRDPPPPLEPTLPPGLADVILRCLSKKPGDRFPTVADLAAALAPYTDEKTNVERVRRVMTPVDLPPIKGNESQRHLRFAAPAQPTHEGIVTDIRGGTGLLVGIAGAMALCGLLLLIAGLTGHLAPSSKAAPFGSAAPFEPSPPPPAVQPVGMDTAGVPPAPPPSAAASAPHVPASAPAASDVKGRRPSPPPAPFPARPKGPAAEEDMFRTR